MSSMVPEAPLPTLPSGLTTRAARVGATTNSNVIRIAFMEIIGKDPGTVHASLHGPSTTSPTSDATSTFTLPAGQNLADAFHLYAVEWEPGVVRFYVDTNLYATFTQSRWPAGGSWVFDHPFFILLNVAVGGNWPGSPDNTTQFPQQMLVDYVRIYTKQ